MRSACILPPTVITSGRTWRATPRSTPRDDAARLADDKWTYVLDTVWPDVSIGIAGHLGLADGTTLVPAPNTHEFVNRLLSCCPIERPARVS